jgi:hypothetical protein
MAMAMGTGGIGMIETKDVSGAPLAKRPWKYSVMGLMTVANFSNA